jgi:hypothetical protein
LSDSLALSSVLEPSVLGSLSSSLDTSGVKSIEDERSAVSSYDEYLSLYYDSLSLNASISKSLEGGAPEGYADNAEPEEAGDEPEADAGSAEADENGDAPKADADVIAADAGGEPEAGADGTAAEADRPESDTDSAADAVPDSVPEAVPDSAEADAGGAPDAAPDV